jgi:Uma2 family endonuclease
MTAIHPLRMNPDDFLAWEIRQSRKHELVGGVIKLMADQNRAKLQVKANLTIALKSRLRGQPREALAGLKIVIPNKNLRYADVAVDGGPFKMTDLVATGPRVAFEVESPSNTVSETMDRLADYQSVETMDHVVLLAQTRAFARVWTRSGDGWASTDAEGLEAALELPALGLRLPLSEVYDGVTFEPPEEDLAFPDDSAGGLG